MERTIKASKRLEDGVHKGIIIGIAERDVPFEYIDIVVETEEKVTVKIGYPDYVSPESKLGQALQRFGLDLSVVGAQIDLEKTFLERQCEFQSITKKGKDGKDYGNPIADSLKPIADKAVKVEDV